MANKKLIEGERMFMVEEPSGKGTKIRKAKQKDVGIAPTRLQPRVSKKMREMSINENSIKRNK